MSVLERPSEVSPVSTKTKHVLSIHWGYNLVRVVAVYDDEMQALEDLTALYAHKMQEAEDRHVEYAVKKISGPNMRGWIFERDDYEDCVEFVLSSEVPMI